ncbi:alpha/beta hydrolase [Spirosoma validum]|uniref:Alpha/beta fold hydrolase n=1 Tax=Spirosoma validum TaxID=2771355 RepID=A0A927B317_9BACT|nr:alpha/beta fold hydrolase [Spirosoma validum]MBD2754483.1 alpha/beta fold hydrolase [Spirosoma validum]
MKWFLISTFLLIFPGLEVMAQTELPMQLKTADLLIDGTLTLPVNKQTQLPVVLLIAGSGPTDRNGNNLIPVGQTGSVKANSYKYLADSLAKLGIATVRYDKRGVGRSVSVGMNEKDIKFETYINDAVIWVNQLKADKRFTKVVVAGHSEGSLIGMVAARLAKADKYISLAGPGDDIATKLKTQLKPQLPEADRMQVFNAIDSLKAGFTLSSLPTAYPAIRQLFRPSVQPYMISWMKYDPAAQIKLLTVPVLIIQGKRDVQVMVSDAQKLKGALPSAQIRWFDEMNHAFKNASTSSMQEALTSYNDPNLPLTPGLATTIAQFVKS